MEDWRTDHMPDIYREMSDPGRAGVSSLALGGEENLPAEAALWEALGDAETRDFLTSLTRRNFERGTTGDYAPLEGVVRYIVGTPTGTVGRSAMPADFLTGTLFALDTDDEAELLGFVRRYGVSYSPYAESKSLYLERRLPAGRGGGRVTAALVGSAWAGIERWRSRISYIDAGDGFSKRLEGPAKASEGIRIELSERREVDLGAQRVVSLEEVRTSLELFRECAALLLSLNASRGAWGPAVTTMLHLGVVPRLLLDRRCGYRSMGAGELLSIDAKEGEVTREFFEELRPLLPDCLTLVGAYLAIGGGGMADPVAVCGWDVDCDAISAMYPAGPLEVAARMLVDVCTDGRPWAFCRRCGRPFKTYIAHGEDASVQKRHRDSVFCSQKCQRGYRDEAKKLARRAAQKLIREEFDRIASGNAAGRKQLFSDIAAIASERHPSIYSPKKCPSITASEVEGLYLKMAGKTARRRKGGR